MYHSENLDESNYVLYAAAHYDNPQCYDTEEFYEDLKKFKYLRRLFNKYRDSGEIQTRLILNHIIVLNNVFGARAATRLLFLKLTNHLEALKPFLELIGTLPVIIENINGKNYLSKDIRLDTTVEAAIKEEI